VDPVRKDQVAVAAEANDKTHLLIQQRVKDLASVESAVEGVKAPTGKGSVESVERREDDQVLAGRLGVLDAERFQHQGQRLVAAGGIGLHAPVAGLQVILVAVADQGDVLEVAAARLGKVRQIDGDDRRVRDPRCDAFQVGVLETIQVPGFGLQFATETLGRIVQRGGAVVNLTGHLGDHHRARGEDAGDRLPDEAAAHLVRDGKNRLQKLLQTNRNFNQKTLPWHDGLPSVPVASIHLQSRHLGGPLFAHIAEWVFSRG